MTKDYKRITVTIKKELLDKVDEKSRESGKSRSNVMDDLLVDSLSLNKVKKAVILAGGVGKRLRPLTYELPKPLLPVRGKPLMEHTFDLLRKYGITDLYISVGYKAKQITDYFGDGKKYGLNIDYIKEKEPLGTAGPLKTLKGRINSPFLLIWCDILTEIDLYDYMNYHFSNPGVATIALSTIDDTSRFGVAAMKGNRILDFVEKPKLGEEPSNLINAGYVILEPTIFDYLPRKKMIMIEKDIYPRLAKEGKLFGYPFEGAWFDTGTHEAYEDVIKKWKGIKN